MHQLAQRRIVFALRIDIYDVGAVTERLAGLLNHAVNMVDGESCLQNIPLCNENNVGFPQLFVAIAGVRHVCVQQAAVVSGTVCIRAFVPPLDLNVVVLALLVNRQNIQTNRAPLKILDAVLTMDFLNNEIAAFQNDMQQQLRTFLILEDLAHKVIVQQAKALQETHVLGILPYKLLRKTGECIQFFCFHDVSSSCWQQ